MAPQNTQIPGVYSAISGLRYYSPTLGRFLNRDPISEQGGLNLYGFCGNNGVNRWDYLGMILFSWTSGLGLDRGGGFGVGGWGGKWNPFGIYDVIEDWTGIPASRLIRAASGQMMLYQGEEERPRSPNTIATPKRGAIDIDPTNPELAALARAQLDYILNTRMPNGNPNEAARRINAILDAGQNVTIFPRDINLDEYAGAKGVAEPRLDESPTGSFITYNVMRGNESISTLAHEISHAHDFLYGVHRIPNDGRSYQEHMDRLYRDRDRLGGIERDVYSIMVDRDNGRYVYRDEMEARRVENQVRDLLGLDILETYQYGPNNIRTVPDPRKYIPKNASPNAPTNPKFKPTLL